MLGDFYLWVKAGHIIAVIFWMAALLMMPRLFVYHSHAKPGGELELEMVEAERRLKKIIMTPAMLTAFILGLILVAEKHGDLFHFSWLWVKLVLVFGLMGFHGALMKDAKKFAAGERPRSEKAYRLMNEIPAIIAIIVVIMAVVKPF